MRAPSQTRPLLDKTLQCAGESVLVALKAGDHGGKESGWIEPLEIQRMASGGRKCCHECELGPAISIPEGVDGVQLRQKMCRPFGERLNGKADEIVAGAQRTEYPPQLGWNMFGIAEHAATLGDANAPKTTGPWVDVAEDVPVHREVVADAQASGRKWLGQPLRDQLGFIGVEGNLIAQSQAIAENGAAPIAVRIGHGIVQGA